MAARLVILLVLIFTGVNAIALQAVVSHAVFCSAGPNREAYVEVYWQIDPLSLQFARVENAWRTKIKTDVIISSDSGIVKEDHYFLQTTPAISIVAANEQSIIDLQRYKLRAGKMRIRLSLTDDNDTTKKYFYEDTFSVVRQPGAFYSDVQLLDTTYDSEEGGVLQKNHRQQIPLCANFLDDRRVVLHYYCELYNVDSVAKESYPLIQKIFVSKEENGSPVLKLQKTDTVVYNSSLQPLIGSFEIPTLPSGNYYINFNLVNKDGVVTAYKTLFFQRYNSKPLQVVQQQASAKSDSVFKPVNVLDLNKTFVMQYTLPELKAILKMLLPVSTPLDATTINAFLRNPDDGYMRLFIYNHFVTINKKDPEAAWKDFTNRIKEINKEFGTRSTPGYETERGRIYLKYGKPDEMIDVENEMGALPYTLWQYNDINNKYKNAVFLFYKPGEMVEDYKLLHSTVPGETRNPAWRSFLYINSTGSIDPNSRAEQYIGKR